MSWLENSSRTKAAVGHGRDTLAPTTRQFALRGHEAGHEATHGQLRRFARSEVGHAYRP